VRNAHPCRPETVVGLANRVGSEELNKLILAVSYAILVPLVDGVRPLHEVREGNQWISVILNLIQQLPLSLLESLPPQLQLFVHPLIF
jgi:hypothetical protein